jgi:hypothetical protein
LDETREPAGGTTSLLQSPTTEKTRVADRPSVSASAVAMVPRIWSVGSHPGNATAFPFFPAGDRALHGDGTGSGNLNSTLPLQPIDAAVPSPLLDAELLELVPAGAAGWGWPHCSDIVAADLSCAGWAAAVATAPTPVVANGISSRTQHLDAPSTAAAAAAVHTVIRNAGPTAVLNAGSAAGPAGPAAVDAPAPL